MTRIALFTLPLFLLASCIGTDLVDEPLGGPVPGDDFQAVIEEAELSLLVGGEQLLTASLVDDQGDPVSATWTWTSRDANIASVDTNGLVRALASGQTWIDGVANGQYRDSVQVTVTEDLDAVASVIVQGSSSQVEVGQSLQLTAVARNVLGDELAGKTISWSSEQEAVATVSASGLVTAVATGDAGIRASSEGVSSLPFVVSVVGSSNERSGTFSGLNGYSASGTATLLVDGGSATLTLQSDFQTQNGPGLFIYLSPVGNGVSGGVNLGELKATSGMQTYDVPDSVDPADFDFVIIYCQPFGVPFGRCELN